MESFAQHLTERSFWLSLAPALRIEDRSSFNGIRAWDAGRDGPSLTAELDRDGYVHIPHCQGEDRTRTMADAVIRPVESGIPAPFCMVFDEFWCPPSP